MFNFFLASFRKKKFVRFRKKKGDFLAGKTKKKEKKKNNIHKGEKALGRSQGFNQNFFFQKKGDEHANYDYVRKRETLQVQIRVFRRVLF